MKHFDLGRHLTFLVAERYQIFPATIARFAEVPLDLLMISHAFASG
jgi:hypothetical protein